VNGIRISLMNKENFRLEEFGVRSATITSGDHALKVFKNNGWPVYNFRDTTIVAELSWGWDTDGKLTGIAEYGQTCEADDIYLAVAKCLDGFIYLYTCNEGSNRNDKKLNWSAHEVLENLGLEIEDFERHSKYLKDYKGMEVMDFGSISGVASGIVLGRDGMPYRK